MSKKKRAAKKRGTKNIPNFSFDNKIYFIALVALVLGLIIGVFATKTTVEKVPSLIQTSCDIDIQTLYEKPCIATEDCYGRLELCSRQLHKCMTTVQVDKTDLRNIRIPNTREECEANGGTWKVEVVTSE